MFLQHLVNSTNKVALFLRKKFFKNLVLSWQPPNLCWRIEKREKLRDKEGDIYSLNLLYFIVVTVFVVFTIHEELCSQNTGNYRCH